MGRAFVIGILLLFASVAMAAEPLEIRSRLVEAREVDGMLTGAMLVEVVNRGAESLDQVVVRPEGQAAALFGGQEIVIGELQPGIIRPVTIPVKASKATVEEASAKVLTWEVEYASPGKSKQTRKLRGLNNLAQFTPTEGGAR